MPKTKFYIEISIFLCIYIFSPSAFWFGKFLQLLDQNKISCNWYNGILWENVAKFARFQGIFENEIAILDNMLKKVAKI
jgi:hypothetical protein